MQRRTALGLLGSTVTAALAGCLGGDDDDGGDDGPVIESEFEAESEAGGIVWFGEPDEEEARDDALALPPSDEIPDPVALEAEVEDDGTWESTELDFPPIEVGDIGVSPEVEAPDGFTGEFDEQEGRWTVEGDLVATIETGDGDTISLDFPLNATTGESGDLEGSFDVQDDSIVATIVDNESVVEDTFGVNSVDNALNLPGEFVGDNWFELTLELEPL